MPYTLLAGAFVIRYPDLPRGGPEPDGDTIKFAPDAPELIEGIRRVSGRPPDLNARGISVRLEAIDALETHFAETHQELDGANAARDELLSRLGFTGVTFWPDLPNKIESADQDQVRGHVLTNGIDANGRMIGFVYPGEAAEPDGSTVFLEVPRADESVNARLLAAGLVYPAFYTTLPAQLRTHLAGLSRAARARARGWALAPVDRRPERAGAHRRPRGARAARAVAEAVPPPRALPGRRRHRLRRLRRLVARRAPSTATTSCSSSTLSRAANLHDVIRAEGDGIQLTAWPEDFVIRPDP